MLNTLQSGILQFGNHQWYSAAAYVFPFQTHNTTSVYLAFENCLISFDITQTGMKMKPLTILCCCRNIFIELLLSSDRGIYKLTDSPLIRHGPHRK
jgi:hypothetical protein